MSLHPCTLIPPALPARCSPNHHSPKQIGLCKLEIHIKGLKSSQTDKFVDKKRFVHVAVQVGGAISKGCV